jgi:serine/threonine-protein kinase HipA
MPLQDMQELRTYAGTEDLFAELMQRYASYSGISGVQPKVLVRDADTVATVAQLEQFSYRDATHIVKAWNPERFPQLAANEYFCMQAARKAGLETPDVELAAQGRLLIVKRFDLDAKGGYLGFEDFCVLNGLATDDKYVGSYQDIAQRIRQFVSPHRVHEALEQFFLSLALSSAVRNGDAHLKNFGVLYHDPEGDIRLAPAFDIVSTTPYIPNDTLALLFGGSKTFPERKSLLGFARQFCNINERRASRLLAWVAHGLEATLPELQAYQLAHPDFSEIGERMQAVWRQGIADITGNN